MGIDILKAKSKEEIQEITKQILSDKNISIQNCLIVFIDSLHRKNSTTLQAILGIEKFKNLITSYFNQGSNNDISLILNNYIFANWRIFKICCIDNSIIQNLDYYANKILRELDNYEENFHPPEIVSYLKSNFG